MQELVLESKQELELVARSGAALVVLLVLRLALKQVRELVLEPVPAAWHRPFSELARSSSEPSSARPSRLPC